jgi:RNA polymerase sigma-70 factor (ECF subfamily)
MASSPHPYSQHSNWLRRVLARRFGAARADDLVQETFMRLASWKSGAADHPRSLLVTIAVNAARDEHRKAMVRGGGNTARLEDVFESFEPSICADQLETLLLKQIIMSLPVLYRDVFVLSRFRGLTYEEIASHCGLSVKTVEWRMSKALALCADQLAK